MNVLVACEFSGRVRQAFRNKGHNAYSCDVLPSLDDSPYHLQQNVLPLLTQSAPNTNNQPWDLLIAHPPCTYLARSGLHWNKRDPQRQPLTEFAIIFFMEFYNAPIPKIAVENPVGIMSTRLRKPDQYIQPYEYGHPESKRTCLWLKNLPTLQPTNILPPDQRSDNLTPSGQNKLGETKHRKHTRSLTYEGWAQAMADQWGVPTLPRQK